MNLFITKRLYFSCAHLSTPHPLSTQTILVDQSVTQGFGSNFHLFVTAGGFVNPITGMILSLTEFKKLLLPILEQKYDHHYLSNFNTLTKISESLMADFESVIPSSLTLDQVMIKDEIQEGAISSKNSSRSLLLLGDKNQILVEDQFQLLIQDVAKLNEIVSAVENNRPWDQVASIINEYPGVRLRIQVNPTEFITILPNTIRLEFDYWFSYPHQISNHVLSDEENAKTFGRCINFHGHNFRLRILLEDQTGARAEARSKWNRRLLLELNKIAKSFQNHFIGKLGTCENLLSETIAPPLLNEIPELRAIQLRETENNFITLKVNNNDEISYFN